MFLPVQSKPPSSFDYSKVVIEIPNVISEDIAIKLKEFAVNKDISGWHRRGSKVPELCKASFYTCLVFPHNIPINEILDPAWKEYCSYLQGINLDFVEHYEIKSYVEGDEFSNHNDILVSADKSIERKINLIVQLCHEDEYDGGDLTVGSFRCTRKYLTGIFFPSQCVHSVSPVIRGTRFSLIGHAWGPYYGAIYIGDTGMPGQLSPQESPGRT